HGKCVSACPKAWCWPPATMTKASTPAFTCLNPGPARSPACASARGHPKAAYMSLHFDPERQTAGHRSTLVSVAVNITLTIAQMVVGIFAHSQALVADAIHSLSDLVSDGVVLIANKHSHKAPDADHPHGHRRFETAASL